MIEIFLFIIAALLGSLWFSLVVLPIFHGIPRTIYWVIRGKLKLSSTFYYLRISLLWILVFAIIIYMQMKLFPKIDQIIFNSVGFYYGQMFGVIGSFIYALTKKGRNDINDDFWDKMKKYEKVSNID